MKKQVRKYEKQFKCDCVDVYLSSNCSMKKVADDFGIPYQTFCGWVSEYKKNGKASFKGKGIIKELNEDFIKLKKELAEIKMERDILKKAAAIFLSSKK